VCSGSSTSAGRASYRDSDWSAVVQAIASATPDRRLVDRAGLSGRFDFDLTYGQSLSAELTDASVDIFTAVRQQLGLKLDTARAPMEVLVVDAVDRPTAD
jgi:uncharacterized protein (TIGR03435 family)